MGENLIKSKINIKCSYFISGIIFKIALDLCFCGPIQTYFSSSFPIDISIHKIIVSYIATMLMIMMLPSTSDLVSSYIIIVLFYIIIPFTTIYAYMNTSSVYFITMIITYLFIEVCVVRLLPINPKKIVFSGINLSRLIEIGSIIFILLTAVVLFWYRGTPNLNAFNLYDVYELRSSYSLPTWVRTMYNISSKTLIPFVVSISLYRKKYVKAIAFLFIQLLFFMWLGNKLTLLGAFLVPAVYFVIKHKKNITPVIVKILVIGVIGVSLLLLVVGYVSPELNRAIVYAFGLFVRRNIFVPAYLKTCYYDFFVVKGNPLIGFFSTLVAPILSWVGIDYPYASEGSFTQAVGMIYAQDSNANTGIFGRELAHFGFVGIFVAAICFVIILYAIRCSEQRNNRNLILCITIYNILLLNNSGSIEIINISPMLIMILILILFDEKYVHKRKVSFGSKKGSIGIYEK